MRSRVQLTLKPPTAVQRAWYRRLGEPAPEAVASSGPRSADYARLVPYRYRRFHRAYALAHRYFWLPCVLCGEPYGGHEHGGSIPDPCNAPDGGLTICSRCTRARNRGTTEVTE